jgi:hypothetical protein
LRRDRNGLIQLPCGFEGVVGTGDSEGASVTGSASVPVMRVGGWLISVALVAAFLE